MFRVTQFSDTHFSVPGHRSHGGFGYDTDAACDAIFSHAFTGEHPELVVVTGDIADRGRPDEYQWAAEQLRRIPVPTNVLPGNHDFHVPFEALLPRRLLTMSRTLRVENWLFLFADSNFGGRELGDDGRLHDKHDRIEGHPQFGPQEMSWLSETISATDADHAFIWVHHPPRALGSFHSPVHDDEAAELVHRNPKLKGFGAGHTHTDAVADVGGRPIFTCPAFTINLDWVECTLLPPGYRTYEFESDGSISSTCHLMDAEQWPRRRLPAAVGRWLMGEITGDEMRALLKR